MRLYKVVGDWEPPPLAPPAGTASPPEWPDKTPSVWIQTSSASTYPGQDNDAPDPAFPRPVQAEPDDRDVLSSGGVTADADGLLRFFRWRLWTTARKAEVQTLIGRLGDPDFEARETATADLTLTGPEVVPMLRAALADPDPERKRRVRGCLETITRRDEALSAAAAARALVRLAPPGTATALVAYLPYAANDAVAQAVREGLRTVRPGRDEVKNLIRDFEGDRQPERRAALASLLGADAEGRKCLARLAADREASVRLAAAEAMARAGERSALPVLHDLLLDAPLSLAWRAEGILGLAAGADAPTIPLQDTPAARRDCRNAWAAYWERHPGPLKLREADFGPAGAGHILLTDIDEDRIQVLDRSFKEQWRVTDCRGPVDVHVLPNGRLLVAENYGERITERDRWGRVVWEHELACPPLACWRVPNGNTGIVTRLRVFEITPGGQEAWSLAGGFTTGCRLRDGSILVWGGTGGGTVLSPEGKEVRQFMAHQSEPGDIGPVSVLPNGHFLFGNRECDRDGKPVCYWAWRHRGVSAARLPNGHTLVAGWGLDAPKLIELDREDGVIRTFKTDGRPWQVQVLP